jgi:hypothetical protein
LVVVDVLPRRTSTTNINLYFTVQAGGIFFVAGYVYSRSDLSVLLISSSSCAGGAGDNGKGVPASGKVRINTLQQETVDMGMSTAGVSSQHDYFEPYGYASLEGGDLDFESSGAALLSFQLLSRSTGWPRSPSHWLQIQIRPWCEWRSSIYTRWLICYSIRWCWSPNSH